MLVVAGAQLIYKGTTSILRKLQSSINKFTYAPLMEGLNEYTTQLTNFQAIVQNTSQWFDSGDTVGQIEAITGALNELNDYADKTIYKYSDMMNAVKGFTTAGLTIEDATSVAQGLASLTAYMGEGAQSYASAAYMFNQAMQQGKMQYYQWRSIEQTAGIGGEKTKKLMIETAKAMGKDAPDWNELSNIYSSLGGEEADNTFRDSLKDDWLTADVLLTSMQILNGEFDDAELKAKGFSDEIIEMSHAAVEAAGQVRTYGQFMDAVVESIGTGWSRIFNAIFGDVTVATKMWTNLMNTVTDDIKVATDLISDEAKIFSDLGGRNNIEKILGNIWKIIKNIGKSAYKVFEKMVPNGLGQSMYDLSESLVRITDVLAGNIEPASGFERILVGIGDAVSFLFGLAQRLAAVIVKLVKATKPIWDGVASFVSRFGPQLGKLLENVAGLIEKIGDKLAESGLFEAIGGLFTGASDAIDSGVSGFFITIFDSIGNAIKGIDVDGIFGALINLIKSFTGMFDESADNTKSVWSFIKFAVAIWLAVKMLKPVFKDIASIAKSYTGVGNQFFSIMGAVLAVLIAFEMFNRINIGNILSLWIKIKLLSVVLGLLTRTIIKIEGIAITLAIVSGAFALLGFAVAKIGKLDYGKMWSAVGVMVVLARLIFVLIKRILKINEIGIKPSVIIVFAVIIGAIVQLGLIAALLSLIPSEKLKTGVEAIFVLAVIAGTLTWAIQEIATASDVNGFKPSVIITLAVVIGLLVVLGLEAALLSLIPGDKLLAGVGAVAALAILVGGLMTGLQFLAKVKDVQGFKPSVILSLGVIIAGIVSLGRTVSLLGGIPLPALVKGGIAVAVLGGIIVGLVPKVAKVKDVQGFKPSVILSLGVIIAGIVSLGRTASLLGSIPLPALVKGGAAILILGAIMIAIAALVQKVAKVKDVQGFKPSVILSLGMIIGGIVILGREASLLGSIPWPALVQGGIAVAVLGGIMIAMAALIQKVGKSISPKAVLAFIVAAAGMAVVLIAFAAVASALATLAAIPNVSKASPAILSVAGTVFILAMAVAVLSTLAKQNIAGILIGTLAMVALIAALSLVFDSLSKMNTNVNPKLLRDVGNLMKLLTLLVIALAAVVIASGGIGVAAILAAVAVILALAGAIALVMDELSKAAGPLEAMVDLFELINEINMGKFLANLAVFVDALKKAIPTFANFSAAMGTFSGALLFSAGDMNITTQSITSGTVIPSSGTSGTTEIDTNTATVEAQQGSEIKQEQEAVKTESPLSEEELDAAHARVREANKDRKGISGGAAKESTSFGRGLVSFLGIFGGSDRKNAEAVNRLFGSGVVNPNDYPEELSEFDILNGKLDILNGNFDGLQKQLTGILGDVESYMAIDASQIQIRDYRDVLSDVVLPKGMSMNDAVETLSEIAENWRNGGLATKADVMNEIHVQLNVDGEKLAEITDRVLGKNYAD